MNIMYLMEKSVLHAVDATIAFQARRLLNNCNVMVTRSINHMILTRDPSNDLVT